MTADKPRTFQAQKPTGWLGRLMLRNMNSRHSKVTDWGLSHISVASANTILDIGCGGGRTVSKLAALAGATQAKVYGVDYSPESVAVAGRTNRQSIAEGRVEIRQGSVSHLEFPGNMFDLITAVETHFWWPDLAADTRELFRVLKPGGNLAIIAEVYKGAPTRTVRVRLLEKYAPLTGLKLLSVDEHRDLLTQAGFSDVQISTDPAKGWICATGRKAG